MPKQYNKVLNKGLLQEKWLLTYAFCQVHRAVSNKPLQNSTAHKLEHTLTFGLNRLWPWVAFSTEKYLTKVGSKAGPLPTHPTHSCTSPKPLENHTQTHMAKPSAPSPASFSTFLLHVAPAFAGNASPWGSYTRWSPHSEWALLHRSLTQDFHNFSIQTFSSQ